MELYDAAIVGGGPAGYEAALTLKSLQRNFIWLGESEFGTIPLAESVRNFLSFSGTGEELASLLKEQAKKEGIAMVRSRVDQIYKAGDRFLLTQGETTYSAKTVILATGVNRSGNLPGERDLIGCGVSYCAVCDGALYRGKKIAVILKESENAPEAEYLAGFAKEVYAFCAYEGAQFRAENISVIAEKPTAIEGDSRVEAIVFPGGRLEISGVFFLGSAVPPSALVGGLKERDGHVLTERDQSTNLKGLFAAGDVTGRPYQYIKAAGEGLVAAFSAHEYLLKAEKTKN